METDCSKCIQPEKMLVWKRSFIKKKMNKKEFNTEISLPLVGNAFQNDIVRPVNEPALMESSQKKVI